MTNEVKDRWIKFCMENTDRIIPIPHYAHWDDFLDQFEGYKLVEDEPPAMFSEICAKCGMRFKNPLTQEVAKWSLWHNTFTGKNEKLCKSCFDKQCPEPAVKPTKWITTQCATCGWRSDIGYPSEDEAMEAIEAHRKLCHIKPAEPEPIKPWTMNPESRAKFQHMEDVVLGKKNPEPEPWIDVVAALWGMDTRDAGNWSKVFEAAWKEQERRVSRMIDEKIQTHLNAAQVSKLIADSISAAIKAERERLAKSLEGANFLTLCAAVRNTENIK